MAEDENKQEQPVFYIINKSGTLWKETDPKEVKRMEKFGFKVLPEEQGEALFAQKAVVKRGPDKYTTTTYYKPDKPSGTVKK